jgi:hypothetical protein
MFALSVVSRLLKLCRATTQVSAAMVGTELGSSWTELEIALGKATGTTARATVATALLAALPWNNANTPAGA